MADRELLHINGAMPAGKRHEIIEEFEQDKKGILTNARCLTEGVDVPVVDGVAFLHPKRSVIDIVQASGRAIRTSPGKKYGYIFVPLYLDVNRGEKIEDALERMNYDVVWNVLNALKEADDALNDIIIKTQNKYGETNEYNFNALKKKVVFHISDKLTSKKLSHAIKTKCISRVSSVWDFRFGQLVVFKRKYGHCNVPVGFKKYPSLVHWVRTQRKNQRKGALEQGKVEKLNAINFAWDVHDDLWAQRFEKLVNFKKKHGHCNVPDNCKENPSLGRWVHRCRMNYKKGLLEQDKKNKLNAINFTWDVHGGLWAQRFEELVNFKKKHGHCNVPNNCKKNPSLGGWVSTQRMKYKKGGIDKDKIKKLNAACFEWSILESTWLERLEELRQFKKENGHCNVSKNFKENPILGRWVGTQRGNKKKGALDRERVKKLNTLGFKWSLS